MPTVIDSLVVTLGLDGSKFKTGNAEAQDALNKTRQASARTAKEMQEGGKQAAEFFSAIKNEALGLIGALVGATGLEQMVRKTTTSMADLAREAANLNMDPQKLAAMSMALERFGASGASTRQTIFGISQALESWRLTGQGDIIKWLSLVGADPNNSASTIVEKFMAYAQEHKADAALVNVVGKGLGIDQGTINAALQLKSMAEYWKAYNDAVKEAPTKAATEQALALYKAWTELEQAATGLANKVTTDLSPALESVAKWMTNEIHQHPQVSADIAELVAAIGVLSALRISASAMGLTGVATVFGGILASVNGILVALGVAGLLYEDFHVNGLNAGEDELLDKWRKEHGLPFGDQRRAMEERRTAQYLRDHPNAHLPDKSGPVAFPIPAAQAGANRDAAEQYFLSQDYTPQQVAGILSNIQAESSFNPGAEYKGHYGLFQWDAARQAKFAELFHHPMQQSTTQEQLQFAQWELTHTEKAAGDALRKQTTSSGSGSTFSHDYERPGSDKTDEFRGVLADQYTIHPALRTPPAAGSPSTGNQINVTGPITINTKATDASGIARGFADALTTQANRGLR